MFQGLLLGHPVGNKKTGGVMVLGAIPMAFFSKVAFPAIYQGLFTYFLLLGLSGTASVQSVIVLLALIGVPATAYCNWISAGFSRRRARCGALSRPLLTTIMLPVVQLIVFFWVT